MKISIEKGTLTAGNVLFTEYPCNVEGVISAKLADASTIGLENMIIMSRSLWRMASSQVIVTSAVAGSPALKIMSLSGDSMAK